MELKFDKDGLIPVVVQDHINNQVLMVAWANHEAYDLMLKTGMTHFWSRSRQELWKKGNTSGHFQYIKSIETDCDQDTLLVRVEQIGFSCHMNRPSCFYDVINGNKEITAAILPELQKTIRDRHNNPTEDSYTCKLMRDENKMCKKIVEEAGEFVLAIKDGDQEEMAWELADLIYHVLVAVEKTGLPMDKVYSKLAERKK